MDLAFYSVLYWAVHRLSLAVCGEQAGAGGGARRLAGVGKVRFRIILKMEAQTLPPLVFTSREILPPRPGLMPLTP